MNFNPLSEEEVLNLLPEGEYDFVVKDAEDKISQKGNEMIKLSLSIYDAMNVEKIVYDYLLETMMYKLKHFSDSVGLIEEYKKGGFRAEECKNKYGRCKIKIENKPNSGYPPKNVVRDYVKRGEVKPLKLEEQKEDVAFEDSDLPF